MTDDNKTGFMVCPICGHYLVIGICLVGFVNPEDVNRVRRQCGACYGYFDHDKFTKEIMAKYPIELLQRRKVNGE